VGLKREEIVSRDPEVMGGALVFAGTRVPARSLVDCVSREQATAYILARSKADDGPDGSSYGPPASGRGR
jgi:hypothetical protein